MKKPILSICIPTFNRAQFAYEAALHALNAWDGSEIEVVVSDNGSGDNTQALLSQITDPRLKYYRNERNYGAAYNTHLTFLRAGGRFAYLTSDEDDLKKEELAYLLSYLEGHPETAVFIGGGDLTYTKKRFPDAVYTEPFEALKAIAFKTRYMTGIILNQEMYADKLSGITFEESARKWDAYSFMYAIAWLCCCGPVVTSSHLLFKQPRLTMTDVTNNARPDGIYYYEPDGRINQMGTWARAICELPISDYEKQYMVIKIIYDTVELATRLFEPGYIDEVRKTVPASDFAVYQKRVSALDRAELTDRIIEKGYALFADLFQHGIDACDDAGLLEYNAARKKLQTGKRDLRAVKTKC